MKNLDLIAKPWKDYELLDSGLNRKLERYGTYVIIRPETQAIWEPAHPELWDAANAEFYFEGSKGRWEKKEIPESWELAWNGVRFTVRLTSFKHTGIFPEQEANWEWIGERVEALASAKDPGNGVAPRVLNLFGYTGIASIVAASHGAQVTHADASKQSNLWAKENALLSGVLPENIRFILDDAVKFCEREVRRGAMYEGIILDPPAFGRGPDGEVWHIEEHFPRLLAALKKILSEKSGSFFLLNGYAAGYSAQAFRQATESIFGKIPAGGEYGELSIEESKTGRAVPSGIYVRFVR